MRHVILAVLCAMPIGCGPSNDGKLYEVVWNTHSFGAGSTMSYGKPKVEGKTLTFRDAKSGIVETVYEFTDLKIMPASDNQTKWFMENKKW